jgi:ABC-type lipoprotein release transport system permease subunit
MRALGMRRSRVVRLFVLEGLALGVVSAIAGAPAGGVWPETAEAARFVSGSPGTSGSALHCIGRGSP